MNMFSSLYFLALALSLSANVSAWVFTDVNFNNLRNLQKIDAEENENNELTDDDIGQMKFSLIYPGTKWCGPGNVASGFADLGSQYEADMCCRDHDNCPDLLAAGETRHNLTNNAFYTRLSCDCDETFRRCLHNANSSVANQIGTMYFNGIGTQCFKDYYPITGCKRRGGWFNNKCLLYTFNTQEDKRVQWFDVPNY